MRREVGSDRRGIDSIVMWTSIIEGPLFRIE
jgi:hypothetical protein